MGVSLVPCDKGMTMAIRNRFAEMLPEIVAWRHDIHAHPELMFETHRTAGLVAEKLKEFGCDEVVSGIGRTGVVGVIRGRSEGAGRCVGLRADMDALPILEATGLPHASTVAGAMHACGHAGHTAMLLGAAKYLCETRAFAGTCVVIFQPAEEGGGGGREMVKDGLMERFGIDEIYGMHNWPGVPVGQFAIRPGPFFAAADLLQIDITGWGGHAAKPHETVDATLVASHVVTALQSVVSRNVDPVEQAVVTISALHTDSTAFNVIAQKAVLKGTVRTLKPEVQDLCEARIRAIAASVAEGFGARAEVTYNRNYPVMVNAEAETGFAAAAAEAVAGACAESPLVMGGEDFAFMLNARPGAYILVGNGETAMVHTADYDFNDEAIPAGCSWFAEIVERRLPAA